MDTRQEDAVAQRLRPRFAGKGGAVSDDEVAAFIHDAAESLRDAPVQTFVSLIAENKARNRLQQRARVRGASRPRDPRS